MTFLIDSFQICEELKLVAQTEVGERFVIRQGKIAERTKPESYASSAIHNGVKWYKNNISGEDQSTKRAVSILQDLIIKTYLKVVNIHSANLSAVNIDMRKELFLRFHTTLTDLEKKGIPNLITTINDDAARFFSTTEQVKQEHVIALENLQKMVQKVRKEARNLFESLVRTPQNYVEKKLYIIPRKDSLLSFISWVRDPNITTRPSVYSNFTVDVKTILEKEFSLDHINIILERYGLTNKPRLSGIDIQALYIGLSATLTKEDLNIYLAQEGNQNLSPIDVVMHYRSLKTDHLTIDDSCPYKTAFEMDLELLKLHHLFEKYQIKMYSPGANYDRPTGPIEMMGFYFVRYFFQHYNVYKEHPEWIDKILLLYPTPTKEKAALVQLYPQFFEELKLFTLLAVPVVSNKTRLTILCRKMENPNGPSVLSLGYWWGAKPVETISSSKDNLGWEIINKALNLNNHISEQSTLELIGFESECLELIQFIKSLFEYYRQNAQHPLHDKSRCFSQICLQNCESIPVVDEESVLAELNYYSSISYL